MLQFHCPSNHGFKNQISLTIVAVKISRTIPSSQILFLLVGKSDYLEPQSGDLSSKSPITLHLREEGKIRIFII